MGMRVFSLAVVSLAVIASTTAWGADRTVARHQLNCILADTGSESQSNSRPVVVVFDESAGSLTAKEGDHIYNFEKVSISSATINGQAEGISVGIDRSTLGIAWQQYGEDKVRTEYGLCHPVQPAM